jgi:hypothetical protein
MIHGHKGRGMKSGQALCDLHLNVRLTFLQPLLLNYGRKEQLQLRWGEYWRELGTETERPIGPLRVISDPKKESGGRNRAVDMATSHHIV